MTDVEQTHPLARRALRGMKLPPPMLRDAAAGPSSADHASNVNPYGGRYGSYPPAVPRAVQARYAEMVRTLCSRAGWPIDDDVLTAEHVLLTEGSISALDLLIRAFCEPFKDHVVVTPPTFPFYARASRQNDVRVLEVKLGGHEFDVLSPHGLVRSSPKLVFLCRPNNPVGTMLPLDIVRQAADRLPGGLIVIDEAYVEFTQLESAVSLIKTHRNVVVTRTFSKAWGLAGARVGAAVADPSVLHALRLIQLTYGVGAPALDLVSAALEDPERMHANVATIRTSRDAMARQLAQLQVVRRVYPSEANFLLVELVDDAVRVALAEASISVTDTSGDVPHTIRVSVGTDAGNQRLIEVLRSAGSHSRQK
ncbi:MAG: aminotransferase class I/II-fold pyridoxal phosphate-dependent enzyme [Jatrophihabitantaceae bacterium]